MYKIRKITFKNHPILKNLSLNFCDLNNHAVDTVIFAGNNGTGKSTILNELYKVATYAVDTEMTVEFEIDNDIFHVIYYYRQRPNKAPMMYANDEKGMNAFINSDDFKNRYSFNGIFSDVDINFHAQNVSAVTSMTLDSVKESRRSTNDLPTQIKQLLIDIQALDDSEVAYAVRNNPNKTLKEINVKERMPRFTQAFNQMFDNMVYSRVENKNNYKSILFKKGEAEFSVDNLSSGEKQIVYRGCFLLKDVNAINGAFVFIDEPEISLHPSWQSKIMEYYKNIFTDNGGKQQSQIFAVTHSPFIIHNGNRKNDKVIILDRNINGEIVVKEKPEYYKCTSVEVIKDAFSLHGFSTEKSYVYLEGRTDELYFNKALSVYAYNDIPFSFKWVGYIGENGQEENTGKDALNKAVQFLIGRNSPMKNICLFDCDTNRKEIQKNNVYTRTIPTYPNPKKMKKGIENALVLDEIDTQQFYSSKIKEGDYGDDNTIVEFKKMDFCRYICALDEDKLKTIFIHLKEVIDQLILLFEE